MPRPKVANPVPASVQAIVRVSNPQPTKSKELARAIAQRRAILFRAINTALSVSDLALLARLTSLHEFRMPYSGGQHGELFIHWFYRDRSADRLSRCEIFHLNMLQYFNVLDRVEVIHIRCASRGAMTGAMKMAVDLLSRGKAKMDFKIVPQKKSWEHDTFKECVEYAVETGKFVYYIHFKGASRMGDSSLGISGRLVNGGTDLDILYWCYLMYLALFDAPWGVKAIGPLLHLGKNKSYTNRDISWSQMCKGDEVFHYCGSFQAFDGTYIRDCLSYCKLGDADVRARKLWVDDPYAVEMFLSMVSLKTDVYSLDVPCSATNGIYKCYIQNRIPKYLYNFKHIFFYDWLLPGEPLGSIVVVGSHSGGFYYVAPNKQKFYCEDDPDNYYYNEMCGYKFLLEHIDKFSDLPYVGLEHYRRAFDYTDKEIKDILKDYDIIVKKEHGPYGSNTNLSVLQGCSRHGLNYLPVAMEWLKLFPELTEQANYNKHFGCNMFITTPEKFKAMMTDEFKYITELLKTPNIPRSALSYFCETILTPYIIRKYNSRIFIGNVVMP